MTDLPKRFLHILIFVFVVVGCTPSSVPSDDKSTSTPKPVTGAPGIGDSYFPNLGNGGYDVQRYVLALNVNPATNELKGSVTIEATALVNLASFNLDDHELSIDSVLVNNQTAKFSTQSDELTITPVAPLDSNKPFNTVIEYHASPQLYVSPGAPFPMGWSHAADGTINMWGEPEAAASWFPNNNHPRDKAVYRFEITVPKPWVVAATGVLQDTKDDGKNTTYIWEMNHPMATYLASISVGNFEVFNQTGPNNMKIRDYFPIDFPIAMRSQINTLPAMIAFYNDLFGPYPFDEYGVLIASGGGLCAQTSVSLEAQTMSIHCPNEYMVSEEVLAHELAHQWFGDSVSLKNWQDIWLKEGFATYASWLWDTHNDPAATLRLAQQQKENFSDSDFSVADPSPDDLYTNESYTGGALVLQALRMQVGDDVFFNILRTYAKRYQYLDAGTADFIAVANEVSGKDLSDFFNAWLFSKHLPDLP